MLNKHVIASQFVAFNGWSDEDFEGNWTSIGNTSVSSLSVQSFQPWSSGEPNGHENENCAVIDSNKNTWDDVSCSKEYCPVCIIPKLLKIVLRGLCPYSLLDTHYAWVSGVSGISEPPRGFRNSFIDIRNDFRIILYNNPYTYAIFNESDLVGTHYWIIYNDTCRNNDQGSLVAENTYRLLLSFTACGFNEFNCNDGTW